VAPTPERAPGARPPPAPGWRWGVLVAVSLAMFGNYYVFDALNPVGPLLEGQLGFGQAQIGALDSAYNVAALLVLLLGGVIIDRVGTKRAMVLFGAVTAAGGLVIAFGREYPVMAAGRFVLGLGAEPLIVAATTVLGRWFKGKELAFAMGLNLMIARIGSVAADNSATWAAGLSGYIAELQRARSQVQVVDEQANQELLRTQVHRQKLQLRLQQTVEGLSVVAISYYVLGLVGYLAKAAKSLPGLEGAHLQPDVVVGIAVVPVLLGAAWFMRRLRRLAD